MHLHFKIQRLSEEQLNTSNILALKSGERRNAKFQKTAVINSSKLHNYGTNQPRSGYFYARANWRCLLATRRRRWRFLTSATQYLGMQEKQFQVVV